MALVPRGDSAKALPSSAKPWGAFKSQGEEDEEVKVPGSRAGVLSTHWPPAEAKMGHVRVSAQGRVGKTGSDSEKSRKRRRRDVGEGGEREARAGEEVEEEMVWIRR